MSRYGANVALEVFHWSLYSPESSSAPESIPPAFRRAFRARQPDGEVPLRLRLPSAVAFDLDSCVRQSRAALRRLAEHARDGDGPPSLQLATWFRGTHRPVPLWVGLLALLEEFVHVWDDPQAMPRRAGDRVYARDGWRCTAPGVQFAPQPGGASRGLPLPGRQQRPVEPHLPVPFPPPAR